MNLKRPHNLSAEECVTIPQTWKCSLFWTASRSNAMGRFFVPVLRGVYQRGLVLGAIRADRLVAICGMARPGFCQSQVIEKIKVLPAAVIGNPVKTPVRILNWAGEWARRDPSESHWHLGPVAVEPFFQGQGNRHRYAQCLLHGSRWHWCPCI